MSIGPLNLGDADTSWDGEYEAIPKGRYAATVKKVEWDQVKNANGLGKMPTGTPMLKVQFSLIADPYHNRVVFAQYLIPPSDYDKERASKMKGMLVNFLIATGEEEKSVRGKNYEIPTDDLVGREVVVGVSRYPKKIDGVVQQGEYNNSVGAVKPAGSPVSGGSNDDDSSGLL
jgi:hypothetical protein